MFILSQGFFSFLCPASKKAGGAEEVGRGHRRDSWPKLAKELFHTIWHHAQYINWGSWLGGGIAARELTGHRSTSGEQLHCAPLALYSLILLVLLLSYYYYHYHCFSFLSVLLNCLYLNSRVFFLILSPIPGVGGQWASGCVVLSCRLGLNHDSPFWRPTWGSTGWDNDKSDWNVLEQICYKHTLY